MEGETVLRRFMRILDRDPGRSTEAQRHHNRNDPTHPKNGLSPISKMFVQA
jgi:hypothetical protein